MKEEIIHLSGKLIFGFFNGTTWRITALIG